MIVLCLYSRVDCEPLLVKIDEGLDPPVNCVSSKNALMVSNDFCPVRFHDFFLKQKMIEYLFGRFFSN